MKQASFFILSLFLLNSCSLYQSEGRKFLEKNALEFAANPGSAAQWNFEALQIEEPCAELVEAPHLKTSEWSLMEGTRNGHLKVYQSEIEETLDVLVYLEGKDERHFLCAFYYSDLNQRLALLDQDLNVAYQTVQHLENF